MDKETAEQLKAALERLTDAVNEASGLTGSFRQLTRSSSEASTAIDANTGAVAGNTRAQTTSAARHRDLARSAEAAVNSMGKMVSSVNNVARAMFEGQRGSRAFSSGLDTMSGAVQQAGKALALLIPGGPLVKGVIAALSFITTSLIGAAKAASEMSADLFKGYQDMSRSGAAASDGLTGLHQDLHRLNLTVRELEQYNRLISEGRKELVLFGGTVFTGRQRFAEIGEAMTPFREELALLGLKQEELNEATMGYIRLQSRLGLTQNRTTQELAESARKYLIEQDALTKLTGMTRKEQEDAREEIRSQERFRGKLLELEQQNRHQEAKDLEATYLMLRTQNKLAAQGFADISTSMLTTEAAQQSMRGTQGESLRVTQLLSKGLINAAEGTQRVAAAHAATARRLGSTLGQLGVYNKLHGDLTGDLRLEVLSRHQIDEQMRKIEKDRLQTIGQGTEATDKQLKTQTQIVLSQIEAAKGREKILAEGAEPVLTAFQKLVNIVDDVVLGFEKLLRLIPGAGPRTTEQRQAGAALNQAEADVQSRRLEINQAERVLLAAKQTGVKEEIEAAEKTLKAAKESQKIAKQTLETTKEGMQYADARAPKRRIQLLPGFESRDPRSDPMPSAAVSDTAPAAGATTTSASGPPPTTAAAPATGAPKGTTSSAPAGAVGSKESKQQYSTNDLFNFLRGVTGHERNYDSLDSDFRDRLTKMAEEYKNITGKKLPFESGARSPEDNAELKRRGYNVSESSNHLSGRAVDLSTDSVNELAKLGLLGQYGFKQNRQSAWHISDTGMAKGGIASGPKSGYNMLLHGTEAVVPLPDGRSIPISMDSPSNNAADNTELLQVMREVKASIESMTNRADNQRVVAVIEDSIRTQRSSNSILQKILQMSQ
jgi:uncharacterized protein YcbK (DUF882 family)